VAMGRSRALGRRGGRLSVLLFLFLSFLDELGHEEGEEEQELAGGQARPARGPREREQIPNAACRHRGRTIWVHGAAIQFSQRGIAQRVAQSGRDGQKDEGGKGRRGVDDQQAGEPVRVVCHRLAPRARRAPNRRPVPRGGNRRATL
ncbi:hypothetical protein EDB83DRAFT_2454617, partial [Lactarius deliciosus]